MDMGTLNNPGDAGTQQENISSTPPAPPATSAEWDLDGEKITAEQVRGWKQGHMMQSDYTRKTQELAAKEHQYQDELRNYQEWQKWLRENPEAVDALAQAMQAKSGPRPQGNQQQPQSQNQQPNEAQRLRNLEWRLMTYEQQEADRQLGNLLERAKKAAEEKGLPYDENRVLKAMSDHRTTDVKKAVQIAYYEELIAKERTAAVEEFKKKQRSSIPPPSGAAVHTQVKNLSSPDSRKEAMVAAMQTLKEGD